MNIRQEVKDLIISLRKQLEKDYVCDHLDESEIFLGFSKEVSIALLKDIREAEGLLRRLKRKKTRH